MTPSTLATLIASNAKAAIAIGAIAAAGTGGGLTVASAVSNSHAQTGLATASAAQSAHQSGTSTTTAGSNDAAPSVTPATCPAGVKNHGAYVSSVAHATPAPSASPNAHGKAVSAAAKSSCGKPTPGSSADDSETPATHPTGAPSSLPTQANPHATQGGAPSTLPSVANSHAASHYPGH